LRFLEKVCAMLVAIAVGATAFFGAAFLLRVDEVQDVVDLIKRRLRS